MTICTDNLTFGYFFLGFVQTELIVVKVSNVKFLLFSVSVMKIKDSKVFITASLAALFCLVFIYPISLAVPQCFFRFSITISALSSPIDFFRRRFGDSEV